MNLFKNNEFCILTSLTHLIAAEPSVYRGLRVVRCLEKTSPRPHLQVRFKWGVSTTPHSLKPRWIKGWSMIEWVSEVRIENSSKIKKNIISFVLHSLNRIVGFVSIACAFETKWRKNILTLNIKNKWIYFVLYSLNRIFANVKNNVFLVPSNPTELWFADKLVSLQISYLAGSPNSSCDLLTN